MTLRALAFMDALLHRLGLHGRRNPFCDRYDRAEWRAAEGER